MGLNTNDAAAFPARGRSYEAKFGDLAFRLDFDADGKRMTFSAIGAKASVSANESGSQTISYTAVPIRPDVFLVYWQEAGGTTVTHVEDFGRNRVYSNITTPEGTFLNLAGDFTPISTP
ncbi:hypothetical protein LZC95_40495 [Pendulispora brunnea]|uniref:MoaF-like domain-containing protein n=1 Tax=Pendulispora brunnea TaxID=2905690 RepID=A0ABZ2K1V3_9BACT